MSDLPSQQKQTKQNFDSAKILNILCQKMKKQEDLMSLLVAQLPAKDNMMEIFENVEQLQKAGCIWKNEDNHKKYLLLDLTNHMGAISLPSTIKITYFQQIFNNFKDQLEKSFHMSNNRLLASAQRIQILQKKLSSLECLSERLQSPLATDQKFIKILAHKKSSLMNSFKSKLKKLSVLQDNKSGSEPELFAGYEQKNYQYVNSQDSENSQKIDSTTRKQKTCELNCQDLDSTKTPKAENNAHLSVCPYSSDKNNKRTIFDRIDRYDDNKFDYSPISPMIRKNKTTKVIFVRR